MKKSIVSVFIIVIVCLLAVNSWSILIRDASYETYENNCDRVIRKPVDRNVVLRVDDIQSYYLRDIQIMMIKDALSRNKTLSLSVIPFRLSQDKQIFRFLEKNKCNVEIALHGYDNRDYEFANLGYNDAMVKIQEGLNVLNEIEPDVLTFVPPNNEFSRQSEVAVYDSGLRIISAEVYNSDYGYTQSHFDWHTNKFVNHNQIISECNMTLNKNQTCIIMFHPQNYVTEAGIFDEKKYQDYLLLLDSLDELDATVLTFKDLYYKDVLRLN